LSNTAAVPYDSRRGSLTNFTPREIVRIRRKARASADPIADARRPFGRRRFGRRPLRPSTEIDLKANL